MGTPRLQRQKQTLESGMTQKTTREFNWSVTVHNHNLVTLLVHQNPLAHAPCGTRLDGQHHLLKHSPFVTSLSYPSPSSGG